MGSINTAQAVLVDHYSSDKRQACSLWKTTTRCAVNNNIKVMLAHKSKPLSSKSNFKNLHQRPCDNGIGR